MADNAQVNSSVAVSLPDPSRCSGCSVGDLCVALGSDAQTLRKLDELLDIREPIAAGDHILVQSDPFRGLLAVRRGLFKSYTTDREGREQIQGFYLPGELIGLEGVSRGHYGANVQALSDAAICRLDYDALLKISACSTGLQQQLFRLFSSRLASQHWRTGDFAAIERLAVFLLDVSERFEQRGENGTAFELPMARSDIANFLGLATETVSRAFGRLASNNIISVRRKQVRIVDREALLAAAGAAGEAT
ncbi:MAG: helix-turn-helix domain-containing protein [Pseudomonadota bacterium]